MGGCQPFLLFGFRRYVSNHQLRPCGIAVVPTSKLMDVRWPECRDNIYTYCVYSEYTYLFSNVFCCCHFSSWKAWAHEKVHSDDSRRAAGMLNPIRYSIKIQTYSRDRGETWWKYASQRIWRVLSIHLNAVKNNAAARGSAYFDLDDALKVAISTMDLRNMTQGQKLPNIPSEISLEISGQQTK